MPHQEPLLVSGCIESSISESASQLFGLELLQLDCPWEDARDFLEERTDGSRPIIAIATLGNECGEMDDFNAIRRLSKDLPIFLHVDASRTFDYMTTMSSSDRKRLALPRLLLRHPFKDTKTRRNSEPTISAATIVGAGTNSISPPPTVILKPRGLGTPSEVKVEYVRGTDSTLAGSRDALGPLLMCLQELRFGSSGIREIYSRCQFNREALQETLESYDVKVEAPRGSLDLVIEDVQLSKTTQVDLGLKRLGGDSYLATVQPGVTKQDVTKLAGKLVNSKTPLQGPHSWVATAPNEFPIAKQITETVKSVVDHFRVVGKFSGGYPLNQAPYSALGPIIGNFLPVSIPSEWAQARAAEILSARKSSFGLPSSDHDSFPACFTTGSTMGNRVGVHTALSQHPGAYFYYSSVTHYSVKKVVRDSDALTSIWQQEKRPRFAEIPADDYGRMQIPLLIEQVRKDKAHSASRGSNHQIILFANIGTTFVGGRDDITGIRSALASINADISYLHVDGALDLGFAPDSVSLGPPSLATRDGLPVVQGLTLSHHKAFGIMISGEVICYNPTTKGIPTATEVDARIVFETWLFQQMYTPADLRRTRQYCFDNSTRLRRSLEAIGLATRHNQDCMITLLERIPPWLVEEFHLAPEGEWVHYITMPHITPTAIEHFVASIFRVVMHFAATFRVLRAPLSQALGQDVQLQRVRYHDTALFGKVSTMAQQSHDNRNGPFDLDAFKRKYIYSAMTYAAFGLDGEPLTVFLTEASAERRLAPGPVLFNATFGGDMGLLEEIGRLGFEYLARRMGLTVARAELKRKTFWQERRCSEPVHERPRRYIEA